MGSSYYRDNYQISSSAAHASMSMPMQLKNYCDAYAPCNPNNPEIVQKLLSDIQCVFQKEFGSSQIIASDCKEYEAEINELRQRIADCERCKAELERELIQIQNDLQAAIYNGDEEAQKRCNLEAMVAQYREQLEKAEHNCFTQSQQVVQFQGGVASYQAQLDTHRDYIVGLEAERKELIANCQAHETGARANASQCGSVQAALEKCCKEYDELLQNFNNLQFEMNKLQRENEELRQELRILEEKFKREKENWEKERTKTNELISKYQGEEQCLRKANEEACRKFKEIIGLHHKEMDCLKQSKDDFCSKYEAEKKAREELEKKLRDCEERKQQQQQNPLNSDKLQTNHNQVEQSQHQQNHVNEMQNQCDQFQFEIQRLEKERADLQKSNQAYSQQLEEVEIENANLQQELVELKENVVELESLPVIAPNRITIQNMPDPLMERQLETANAQNRAFELENMNLQTQLLKLNEEKADLEKEIRKLRSEYEASDVANGNSLRQAQASKYETEEELRRLQASLEEDYVERKTLEKLKAQWETKYENLRSQCEVDKDSRFGKLEEEIKKFAAAATASNAQTQQTKASANNNDPNDNPAENDESKDVVKALKHEMKTYKKMITQRDEHITELKEMITTIKAKYADHHKELRLRRIELESYKQAPSTVDQETFAKGRENLEKEQARMIQDRKLFERKQEKLQEELKAVEAEKLSLKNLAKMKNSIEAEVLRLREAISNQFVDRGELERLKVDFGKELERLRLEYEEQLTAVRNQFHTQLEMNRQLAEINEFLGKQSKDRTIIDQIRDSNETLLRKELQSVSVSLQLDTEKLKKLIEERDGEIVSLRKAVRLLKTKYATEAEQREDLMKKVKILSTISQETLNLRNDNCSNNNNNNNNYELKL